MDNITEAPAEQTIDNQTEAVRDAEAVLRKNRELLAELADVKRKMAEIQSFPFDEAKAALEARRKAEEESLVKKGEFEKLYEQRAKAYEEKLESERRERTRMESTLKQEKLALALIEKGVLPDRVHYLVKELGEQVELGTTDTGFVLRKSNGIGDAEEFNLLIEDVKAKSPFFFAANIATGTGGAGSNGSGAVSSRKWDDLNGAEKAVAIREAGGDIGLAKKKFK